MMKTKPAQVYGFLMLCCLFLLTYAHADQVSRYGSMGKKSDVIMEGTSNLHDWRAEGHVINGYVQIDERQRAELFDYGYAEIDERQRAELFDGDLPKIIRASEDLKVDVSVPVTSLKSDLEGLEERIWEGLNYQKYPDIRYSFVRADFRHGSLSSAYTFDTQGKLTVNGVTRLINMEVTIREPHADEIVVECKTAVKMTDFNITPPSFLIGLIKAGDGVDILIHWPLVRKVISTGHSSDQ